MIFYVPRSFTLWTEEEIEEIYKKAVERTRKYENKIGEVFSGFEFMQILKKAALPCEFVLFMQALGNKNDQPS
jgi:predicted GTPase